MATPESFGLWIRQRRKQLDLTQEMLAEQAGCSVSAIRKMEADERRPSREVAALLATCLQIDAKDHATFLKVARSELRVERLAAIPLPPASPPVISSPLAQTPPIPWFVPALPAPSTPFIGRAAEVREVQRLLAQPDCRLLTLVGPGGIGKTRLALATAAAQQASFTHGCVFVALAALTSPEFIIPALAAALDFTFSGSVEPKQQLFNYLQEKQLLLVLDNLEQLLDGVPIITALLAQAPSLKVLATSRERLNLQEEWVFDLQGLPVPPVGQVEQLQGYSAVALFVASVQRVQTGFALTAQNQPMIAQICQLVEGLPLALELAAAWTYLLSCAEIGEEIKRNIDFLAVNRRDVPERHRSLRATFDYSWVLLSREEQRVLRQLAVFRGGFGRAAATQVAGAALSSIASLVAKSLVRRTAQERYELHELVRQYALAHLHHDLAEEQAARDRHALWYLTPLQANELALQSSQQQATLAEMTTELDNIRTAWDWAVTQGQIELYYRAAPALAYYYDLRVLTQEGAAMLHRALAGLQAQQVTGKALSPLEAAALGVIGSRWAWLHQRNGHAAEAFAMLQQSVTLLRQHHEAAGLTYALLLLGTFALFQGPLVEAKKIFQESLTLAQALDRPFYIATSYNGLGWAAREEGAYPEAQPLFQQALAFYRKAGDPRYIAFALTQLSRTAYALDQYAEAQQFLLEGVQWAAQTADRVIQAEVQEVLGLVAYARHELGEAQAYAAPALTLYQTLLDRWGMVRTLTLLGQIKMDMDEVEAAQRTFLEALRIADAEKIPLALLDVLVSLATLYAKKGSFTRALTLIDQVYLHPARTQAIKNRVDPLRTAWEAQRTPQQLDMVRQHVQEPSFTELVAEILHTDGAFRDCS